MKHKNSFIGLMILGVVLLATTSWHLPGEVGASQAGRAYAAALPGPSEALAASPAAALRAPATQPFRQIVYAYKDSWVDQANPSTAHGSDSWLYVGRDSSSNAKQILLGFDLSTLPDNAVVVSATLEMYTVTNLRQPASPELAYNVWVDAANSYWSESTVTWSSKPASTNLGDPPTSVQMGGYGWFSWDVTNIAQAWASGTRTNYGMLLRGDSSTQSNNWFEAYPSSYRSRLTVYYITQGSPLMLAAEEDTWIDQGAPSSPHGSDTMLYVGRDASYNYSYILLKFDTSSLPDDIVVVSATLDLYTATNREPASPELAYNVWADAIHTPWSESTVTWNTRPSASTQGDPPTSVWMGGIGWFSWDVTNIAQGWVTGALDNYGIRLRGDSTQSTNWFYALPNYYMPRLTIVYEPAPCDPATSVSISGPTQGITGTSYGFSASVLPSSATPPFTYTWNATDQSPVVATTDGNNHSVSFTWPTPGSKLVHLTVQNCGSSVMASHWITVEAPQPTCAVALADLSLSGPTLGITGTSYSFTATVGPPTATTPITYTWQASGYSPTQQMVVLTQTVASFAWDATGTKYLSVTAQNCGGTFVSYYAVDIVEPAQMPDLLVSDAWYDVEASRIVYLVKNIGGHTVPPIHETAIYTTIYLVGQPAFTHTLQPGAIRYATFDHEWACPPVASSMRVQLCADAEDAVDEGFEDNNCWQTYWGCDLVPPQIISGPTLLGVTENTASIGWQTNEECQYEVEYGRSYYAPSTVSDNAWATDHQLDLSGLQAGSLYHYQVLVTDRGGLQANSDQAFFETDLLGTDPPQITGLSFDEYDSTDYEFYTLEADMAKTDGLDRVEFYFDGTLVGVDYAMLEEYSPGYQAYLSPHKLGLSRDSFFSQSHALEARAFTVRGVSSTLTTQVTPFFRPQPYLVEIESPPPDYIKYINGDVAQAGTTIDVDVTAGVYEWACTWSGPSGNIPPGVYYVYCGDVMQAAPQVELRLDGALAGSLVPAPYDIWHLFNVDLEGKGVGDHTLAAIVHTDDGRTGTTSQNLTLERGVPSLSMDRAVTKDGNTFRVQLTVANDASATASAELDMIVDRMTGLQAVGKTVAPSSVSSSYDSSSEQSLAKINFFIADGDTLTLDPGETRVVEYDAVPVLYESSLTPAFGDTTLYYLDGVLEKEMTTWLSAYPVHDLDSGTDRSLSETRTDAIEAADYVIVTHPGKLYTNYNETEVNTLLSKMAHLAFLKDGVLGYLGTDTGMISLLIRNMLDNLLEPQGGWTTQLDPNFASSGYVLLVGESEIVPAWTKTGLDVHWNGGGHTTEARYSDLRYASSADEERRPNLALGRVIGNNAQQLAKVIDTSIKVYEGYGGYGFGRSRAMLLSGTGTAASFAPTVDEIQTILQPDFTVDKLHWWEYFAQSSFWRDYEQHDGFAAGDVDNDGDDEIIVGDRADHIYVLSASGTVVGGFDRDFEEGDGLAAGDVNGDGQDEIIIGDRNDHIVTYNESGTQLATFERDYEAFDGLAVGDVDCDGTDEIVMADRNDHIYVFDMTGTVLHDFYVNYEAHDGLGVGNVWGACYGEIIIGDRSADKIHVYQRDGSSHTSFDYDFAEGYGLAVGNVRGDAYDDIVIGNIDDRRLHVYSYVSGDGAFKDKLSMDAVFDSFDGLAVGNVLPGSTELEMLVADRSDQLRIYDLDYCSRMMGAFTPMSQDKDVIYFSGHGNTNIWGPCLVSSNTPSDFGSKNPFVLATSCLTGNYKDWDNYSIAEAFLQGTAGVYIGSTEVSAIGKNNEAGKWFFNNWGTYDTVGRTFTDLKRAKFDSGEVWRLWLYSYNLYGDPKYMPRYGRAPSASSGQTALDALGASLDPTGLRTIEVHIPDFEVNTVDAWDHVEIPGGELWSESGDSEVPYWTVSISYRPGTRVQDVALTGRSGLVVTTGLNVPSVTHDIACVACAAQPSRAPAASSGWSPDPDTQYRWAVYENPDESTTLAISLYPFYYNSQTTDVLFYQDYTLEIETITTSVGIESLTIDQPVSLPGDPISMTLVVENDGAAQDVVVKAVIKASAVGDLVDSLPLRNLHDLSGQAWVDLAWDTADGTSGGQAPGDYLVEIALMDMAGNVLDKAARSFQLGITSGEVTRLSARPELFNVGDVISISMTFNNIGSVPITGTAIIQVQTADALTLTTEFTHSLSNLAVGRARILTDTWDSTGISEGAYRVLGYVLYDATASTPMTATVSTPMAALNIVKTAPITVTAGELFTYTLMVYNTGNVDLTGVTITDALPAHTSFVSADSGGALLASDIVQWKGIALRAGQSRRVSFAVRASSPLTDGIVIVNEHYGVSCAEGASDWGSPAGTTVESGPTMVALSSIDARLARKPAWGVALVLGLALAASLIVALHRRRRCML